MSPMNEYHHSVALSARPSMKRRFPKVHHTTACLVGLRQHQGTMGNPQTDTKSSLKTESPLIPFMALTEAVFEGLEKLRSEKRLDFLTSTCPNVNVSSCEHARAHACERVRA